MHTTFSGRVKVERDLPEYKSDSDIYGFYVFRFNAGVEGVKVTNKCILETWKSFSLFWARGPWFPWLVSSHGHSTSLHNQQQNFWEANAHEWAIQDQVMHKYNQSFEKLFFFLLQLQESSQPAWESKTAMSHDSSCNPGCSLQLYSCWENSSSFSPFAGCYAEKKIDGQVCQVSEHWLKRVAIPL